MQEIFSFKNERLNSLGAHRMKYAVRTCALN